MSKGEFEATPTASYLPFLDHADPPAWQGMGLASETGGRRSRVSAFSLPRRRDARQPLRVRLSAQQIYWLRLAAARAGRKVDEATIVSAALALLEWLDIDWRTVGSRADIEQSLARVARALTTTGSAAQGAPSPAPSIPPTRSVDTWPGEDDPFGPGSIGGHHDPGL